MQNREKRQKKAEKMPYEAPKASLMLTDSEDVLYQSLPVIDAKTARMFKF